MQTGRASCCRPLLRSKRVHSKQVHSKRVLRSKRVLEHSMALVLQQEHSMALVLQQEHSRALVLQQEHSREQELLRSRPVLKCSKRVQECSSHG